MKKHHVIFMCISFCLLYATMPKAQNGPPWIKTNVGYDYIFRAIDFPGNQDMTGYMAGESLTYNGNGIVLKTTDGGNTWVSKWTGVNMGLEGACFVDENTGFVAGWPKLANGWSGFGKTTDGGNTWTSPAVIPDVYYFTDVVFRDASHGVLFGATNTAPAVLTTSNGGTTWTAASGVSNGVPYHACHVSGTSYFLVDNAGHIKKSVDDGATWSTVFTVPGGLLTGIDFFNDNIGMACGDDGLIIRTSDGGATWTIQQAGTDIWHDFGWQDQEHVFCCGTPEIVAESTNGGATWGNGFPGSTFQAALYECVFTPNGSGFICGSQGTLLKREPSCTAVFSANQTGICTGGTIAFTDQSIGDIASWEWTFEGGTPATSNLENPVVAYYSAGVFDVKLIVSNGLWTDTLQKPNYITASIKTTPVISVNLNLLTSNIPDGNQWWMNGALIPGATGQSYQASQPGLYWDVVTQNGCVSDTSNNILFVLSGLQSRHDLNLKAYQVPGTSRIRLETGSRDNGRFDVNVLNCLGAKIFERASVEVPAEGIIEIDPGPLACGIYIVILENAYTMVTRKLVIR